MGCTYFQEQDIPFQIYGTSCLSTMGMPVTIPTPSSVCSKELDMICIRNLDLKEDNSKMQIVSREL